MAKPPSRDDPLRGAVQARPLGHIERIVAGRMSESHATVPDFSIETDVGVGRALDLRRELREAANGAPAPSINDLVVAACARTLREHPRVNAAFSEDGAVELFDRVNVGIAVAGERSLLVATVFDADRKSLLELAAETRRLAKRARGGRLSPDELSGATFTVSNLGMHGVTRFTPIVNAPQSAILAVGSVREQLALRDEAVTAESVMSVTLVSDHRVVYGEEAARFLAAVRARLERPDEGLAAPPRP